jgi:methylated-DNA-protein-cysteine methyltransferase-like protein
VEPALRQAPGGPALAADHARALVPRLHRLTSRGDVREVGFFERVYAVVRRIPRGRVATYGQVAALLGNPRAARSVGWALGALPAGTRLPWHRVVCGDGRIALPRQEDAGAVQAARLRAEGIAVDRRQRVHLERFLWRPAAAPGTTRPAPRSTPASPAPSPRRRSGLTSGA